MHKVNYSYSRYFNSYCYNMPTLVLLKPVDPTVQSTCLHFLIFQYFKAQVMLSYCAASIVQSWLI